IILSTPTDYILNYSNGSLQVNQATLTVTANLKFINRNDPLPAFTSTITGFVPGGQNTIISGPTYSVSPSGCCTQAGQYTITPANLVLAVPGNYNISYVSGPLYVNPKGQGAKKINVSLVCVDTVSNHPSGFPFLARFQWENQNNTPVYVPLGPTNYFNMEGRIGQDLLDGHT
ncbi:MAG: MBG domain-containing protein, partial [Bacteroidota bacterium]